MFEKVRDTTTCRDIQEVIYSSKARQNNVKHILFSYLFALTTAALPIHTNKQNAQMFTNTCEFPQLISSLVWTHREDYPMHTKKKSQNEMSNETLFLLISTAFSALWVRFETCFGKGLEHFFVFGGRKKNTGEKLLVKNWNPNLHEDKR